MGPARFCLRASRIGLPLSTEESGCSMVSDGGPSMGSASKLPATLSLPKGGWHMTGRVCIWTAAKSLQQLVMDIALIFDKTSSFSLHTAWRSYGIQDLGRKAFSADLCVVKRLQVQMVRALCLDANFESKNVAQQIARMIIPKAAPSSVTTVAVFGNGPLADPAGFGKGVGSP